MPIRGLTELQRRGAGLRAVLLAGLPLALAACQPTADRAETAAPPPVGHYEGSITPGGRPAVRAALDIRHPSPGHYAAELTVPGAPGLSFVADTVAFANGRLRLVRPARPAETLALTLDGDFWRGTLAADSLRAETLLVKRGGPAPRAYRVEEMPRANGPAWLFAPADAGTPGPALALLPDSATAPAAALWADALARQGIVVLVLPPAAADGEETGRLRTALRVLRHTPGADSAAVGVWAVGTRADAAAALLAQDNALGVRFFISQNAAVPAGSPALYRALRARNLPLLGLYGGNAPAGRAAAARLRAALGGRGPAVRTYRTAGPDLRVPGALGPEFGPGLPGGVVEWLRKR